jgi:hypothetical protein
MMPLLLTSLALTLAFIGPRRNRASIRTLLIYGAGICVSSAPWWCRISGGNGTLALVGDLESNPHDRRSQRRIIDRQHKENGTGNARADDGQEHFMFAGKKPDTRPFGLIWPRCGQSPHRAP